MVRSALFARVSNHKSECTFLILRDAAQGPLFRMRPLSLPTVLGKPADDHRGQTGAAAAASPEMAVVRQARTGPDDHLRAVVLRLLAVGDVRYRHPHHRPSLAMAAGSHLHAVH